VRLYEIISKSYGKELSVEINKFMSEFDQNNPRVEFFSTASAGHGNLYSVVVSREKDDPLKRG